MLMVINLNNINISREIMRIMSGAILQERDKEFVGEGSRWFDLLRLRDSNGKPFCLFC